MSSTDSRTTGGRSGFTLIELLIVVVIMGLLAAIAIPQFASTRQKAHDAAAQTDLRNMMSAQESYFAQHGEYADDLSALDADTRFNTTDGVTVTLDRPSSGSYDADASHRLSPDCFRVQIGEGSRQEIEFVADADAGGGTCDG